MMICKAPVRATMLAALILVSGVAYGQLLPGVAPEQSFQPTAEDLAVPVVTVNGHELTLGELDRMAQMRARSLRTGIPPGQEQAFREQMILQIVDDFTGGILLNEEAIRREVAVSDEEIEANMAEVVKSFPQGESLDTVLETVGLSLEAFKEEIASDLRVSKLVEEIGKDVKPVGEEEARAFYNESQEMFAVKETAAVRHILLGVQDATTDEEKLAQKEKAAEVLAELQDGGNFKALAAEYSTCPSSSQGGNLGVMGRGATVPPFDAVVFSSEPGLHPEVVETRFGYHVIEVLERTPASIVPFNDVKERIQEVVKQQNIGMKVRDLVNTLRESADIKFGNK